MDAQPARRCRVFAPLCSCCEDERDAPSPTMMSIENFLNNQHADIKQKNKKRSMSDQCDGVSRIGDARAPPEAHRRDGWRAAPSLTHDGRREPSVEGIGAA